MSALVGSVPMSQLVAVADAVAVGVNIRVDGCRRAQKLYGVDLLPTIRLGVNDHRRDEIGRLAEAQLKVRRRKVWCPIAMDRGCTVPFGSTRSRPVTKPPMKVSWMRTPVA